MYPTRRRREDSVSIHMNGVKEGEQQSRLKIVPSKSLLSQQTGSKRMIQASSSCALPTGLCLLDAILDN